MKADLKTLTDSQLAERLALCEINIKKIEREFKRLMTPELSEKLAGASMTGPIAGTSYDFRDYDRCNRKLGGFLDERLPILEEIRLRRAAQIKLSEHLSKIASGPRAIELQSNISKLWRNLDEADVPERERSKLITDQLGEKRRTVDHHILVLKLRTQKQRI